MKTIKIIGFVLTLGLVTFLLNGCKKYEEGGLVSKTEKNLTKTWKLQQYLRNGNDETSLLIISNYEETYVDNGVYSRTYIDSDNENESEVGTWAFVKDQKKLNISGVSSIDLTNQTGTVSSSHYNILKLDDSEFWYSYTNGGDIHEFHMVKK